MTPARYQPVPAIPPRPPEAWLTAVEAAARLGVSKMTVYRLIHAEELPAYRIGRAIRVKQRDLDDYLRGCTTLTWDTQGDTA